MLNRYLLKKELLLILVLVFFTSLITTPALARMSSTNYQITSDVIGAAEGKSTSLNYELLTNMGEEGVGIHDSANWTLKSGFLQTINSTITISLDSTTKDLGTIAPLSTDTATTTIGVITDAIGGYSLSALYSSAGFSETLRNTDTTTYIPDKTDWDPTANGGNGNAETWSGEGFGFTVYANDNGEKNTTWWGTGTTVTDMNNKYAGFSSSSTKILETTNYKSGERQTSVGYKAQIPDGQKSGVYSGDVTFIATVNL